MTTHTFANLEVSAATYDEVRRLLIEAGYHHAVANVNSDEPYRERIDMHGIALVTVHPQPIVLNRQQTEMEFQHGRSLPHESRHQTLPSRYDIATKNFGLAGFQGVILCPGCELPAVNCCCPRDGTVQIFDGPTGACGPTCCGGCDPGQPGDPGDPGESWNDALTGTQDTSDEVR